MQGSILNFENAIIAICLHLDAEELVFLLDKLVQLQLNRRVAGEKCQGKVTLKPLQKRKGCLPTAKIASTTFSLSMKPDF